MPKLIVDASVYNKLPNLDRANAALDKAGASFGKFARDAIAALRNEKLTRGEIGAFLLHRHWRLKRGWAMVERPRLLTSGKVALITAPEPIGNAQRAGVVPSRWAYFDGARPSVSLEFSGDPHVIEISEIIANNGRIHTMLAELVARHRLQKIIGFMIVPRKVLQPIAGVTFVETNAAGISIVTGERVSRSEKSRFITTGWPLSGALMAGTVGRRRRRRGQRSRDTRRNAGRTSITYCSHNSHSCHHTLPDPPVCRPTGCVKPSARRRHRRRSGLRA